ncbi:MAG: ribosome silencing factor [Oligoflexia bacterium]|nr:ribosome silencing factor [Oligoflexia bacterium]
MSKNAAEVLNPGPGTPLGVVNEIINACSDAKGKDILVLDVRKVSDMAQYFVLVSGRSDRQVQGIANKALEALAQHGYHPDSIEGLEEGHWVLCDLGDVVLHVFYEATRQHYDLEGLWFRAGRLQIETQKSGSAIEFKAA